MIMIINVGPLRNDSGTETNLLHFLLSVSSFFNQLLLILLALHYYSNTSCARDRTERRHNDMLKHLQYHTTPRVRHGALQNVVFVSTLTVANVNKFLTRSRWQGISLSAKRIQLSE